MKTVKLLLAGESWITYAILAEIGNQLKLPTPDGFALTATAYRFCLDSNGLGAGIDEILAGPADNPAKAAAIAGLFDNLVLPGELREALAEELTALKRRRPELVGLAVRSSAVGEDGERSFAGQFLTLLDVSPEPAAVDSL